MGILSVLQVISPIFPVIDLPTFNIYIHQERLKVKKIGVTKHRRSA
jgi:hypothetical protein